MDGPHDLGGTLGHGPVQRDEPAQPLAERWHGRVFAMMRTAFAHGVARNTDQFRHAIERLDSDAYFRDGYYGRWLSGLETLWLESGTLSRDELDRRTRALGGSAR
ncbi:MAG: nitrile hydratase subunit beta, partial [Pseudomonadota bacterium]